MRPAEARFNASMMISSSIRLLLTGLQVGWTTNTSLPRTVSYRETNTSPSEKAPTSDSPSFVPICAQISFASFRFALPENTLISFPCEIIS